eukprot:3519593-Karenia_brevis.AAC.1
MLDLLPSEKAPRTFAQVQNSFQALQANPLWKFTKPQQTGRLIFAFSLVASAMSGSLDKKKYDTQT